jgi:thiol-disulfide isomerase/thioredoxin
MHTRRTFRFTLSILAATSLFAAGCGSADKQAETKPSPKEAKAETTTDEANVKEPIQVTAEDLQTIVKDSDADVILLNMWATWCKPCVEEFPDLVRLQREYGDRGFQLVLVSADFQRSLPQVKSFLAEQGVEFQTYLKTQKDQEFITGLHKEWSGTLPATIIYNANGEPVQFWQGKATWEELKERVENLLEGS